MNDTTLRIRKLMRKNPEMTDEQISRKIGREGLDGQLRVRKERRALGVAAERAGCDCGGIFDMCTRCLRRQGDL